MIKYALQCENGHGFEGWFSGSADYDAQDAAGTLSCPICETGEVEKALMAPMIARGPRTSSGTEEKLALFKTKMNDAARKVRDHVHQNFEPVGKDFPEEARKIHYGEAEDRPIYGEATPKQARELAEEGVTVAPLPEPDDELPGTAREKLN